VSVKAALVDNIAAATAINRFFSLGMRFSSR
jgi:hypothetical protein